MGIEHLIGVDIGGTQTRIAEVRDGIIVGDIEALDTRTYPNPDMLVSAVLDYISARFELTTVGLGITAAGIINEETGTIVTSPNFPYKGETPFGARAKQAGISRFSITNDLRGAVSGIATGEYPSHPRVLVATYSSGFNCAVAEKRENLFVPTTTAEFGHLPYRPTEKYLQEVLCACEGRGHLESYVSGNGMVELTRVLLQREQIMYPRLFAERRNSAIIDILKTYASKNQQDIAQLLNDPLLFRAAVTAKDIVRAYQTSPEQSPQRDVVTAQREAIAVSLGMMNGAYTPPIMVLMGGQTNDWDVLFDPALQKLRETPGKYQHTGLPIPKIVRTQHPAPGIVGAVVYLQQTL